MGFNNNVNYALLLFFIGLLLAPFLFTVKAQDDLGADIEWGDETDDDCPSFSYNTSSSNGPQNWGQLCPNWTLCGTGESQSPIDIHPAIVWNSPNLGDLIRSYKPSYALIKKLVHEVKVQFNGDAGYIVINGAKYNLVQFHWHTPTEHAFNRKRYEVELHLVHMNAEGKIAVVGILYKKGKQDPFLKKLLPYIKSAEGLISVDPRWIGFDDREYYRYNGSLTSPGCSEDVTWTVLKLVRTVSPKQIKVLRTAIKDGELGNARPLQPLNGRFVSSFEPVSISSI